MNIVGGIIALAFWVGLFLAVREWRYSRKHGLRITRAEKLYPALAFLLLLGAQPVFYLAGMPVETSVPINGIAIASIPNVWAFRRRLRRTKPVERR